MQTRFASFGAAMGLAVALIVAPSAATPAHAQSDLIITDVQLDDIELVDGVLTADGGTVSGLLAGLPFTTDITNFALQLVQDPSEDDGCAILDLELGPINISLLGLFVDTSPICLKITAFPGDGLLGDLLGGLLCDLTSDLLSALEADLDDLVGDLTDELTGALTMILQDTFDQALGGANGQGNGQGGENSICRGNCVVLFLSLGPVDLTVLGLNVFLDDCDGGPVEVCVSASRGQGVLGNLLCGIAGSRGGRGQTLADIARLVRPFLRFL